MKNTVFATLIGVMLIMGFVFTGCDTGGTTTTGNPDTRSIKIENIPSTIERAGVWLFVELPSGNKYSINTALGSNNVLNL